MVRATFLVIALIVATSSALKVKESPFANPTLERFMAQAYASTAELANNIAKAASPLLNLEKRADDLAHSRKGEDEKNYKEESLLEEGTAKVKKSKDEDEEGDEDKAGDEAGDEAGEENEDETEEQKEDDSKDSEEKEVSEKREAEDESPNVHGTFPRSSQISNNVFNDCCHPEALTKYEHCTHQQVVDECNGETVYDNDGNYLYHNHFMPR